jgi:hypothetical protein
VRQYIPLLPIVELPKLPSSLLLDPTVKFFFPDLWCRSSRGFRFHRFVPQRTPLLPTVELPKCFPNIFTAPSPDLTIVRVFFFPLLLNRSYGSNTPSVEHSLSMVKYHDGFGFILPQLLLSFVTQPSNPLTLKNNLRFEIGSSEHHFHSKPWSKDHLSSPSRLSVETLGSNTRS